MKNNICRKNCFLPLIAVFFLILLINACSTGDAVPPAQWETLVTLPKLCSFSDFTPSGQSLLYVSAGSGSSAFYQYAFPSGGNSQGVLSSLTSYPSPNNYIGFGWYGSYLYFAQKNSMYKYDISGNSWSAPVTTLTYTHKQAQTTADDSGYVYATSDSNYLLKYDTVNDTYEYIATPGDLGHGEPRAAWDPSTGRVYLADYYNTSMYAYNPSDDSFTPLTAFPDASGVSDAFCSDRRGHIYTSIGNDSGSATDVWVYTEATDTWSQFSPSLPFAHGDSAACTISADGYLYFTNGETGDFARIKIF
jgi:hypothetical protein